MLTEHFETAKFLKLNGVTNREIEIAVLATSGLSNKEIAYQLFVTTGTVRLHLKNLYAKLNINSRAQLIVKLLPYMNFSKAWFNSNSEEV